MLTKTELNRIRKLRLIIDALKAEVSDLEIGIQSPSLEDNGSTPTPNIKSSVEARAIRLVEARKRLEDRELEYEMLRLELDRTLAEKDDELLTSILTYRFILSWNWGRIARKLGAYSPDYLRKYYQIHVPS